MYDVISFGGATVDIFAKSNDFIVKDNLLSVEYSSKKEINKSIICSGGGATNSCISFSRLGLKSACVSLLGDDLLKNFIIKDLKDEHISTSFLVQAKNDTTDFSIILVAQDGGRSILTNRGFSRLEEKHIKWDKLKARWFYISSLEGNLGLLEKLIGYAKENNIKIALNPGNRELTQKKTLIPLLKYVDFLLLNKIESEIITDSSMDRPNFWPKINSFHAGIVAITNGRQGAHVTDSKNYYYSPIINVKPVDETGAGDSFGSAFVAGLIFKNSLHQSLLWGIKNSASVVSMLGAKPGLLTLSQIKK